jgi:DNA-binding MarR family transcriptional regulator
VVRTTHGLAIAGRTVSTPRQPTTGTTLIDRLVQLSFEVQSRLGTIAADHDLSLTQVRLLGVLRDHQPGIQQLADHLGLEKSSVSGLIDRAEARGLVRRTSSATDGRAVHVAIAREGRRLAQRAEREVETALSVLVARLTNAERARLAELLTKCLPPT